MEGHGKSVDPNAKIIPSITGKTGMSSIGLVFGQMSTLGRQRTMEDVMTVKPLVLQGKNYSFFAVYDGHGGSTVAEMCGQKLHHILEKQVRRASLEENSGFNWEDVMAECFRNMDEELRQDYMMAQLEGLEEEEIERKKRIKAMFEMGSTATVVVLGKEVMVIANCGDSRAVLSRGGIAMPLTIDHKPDRADEKERIEAAGGIVVNFQGCWRVEAFLATSRSLGDEHLKPYVSWEPEVRVMSRSENDDFLIIATDGLFDVLSNEEACSIVKDSLQKQHMSVGKAAAMLVRSAMLQGSEDNISAIVVQMK